MQSSLKPTALGVVCCSGKLDGALPPASLNRYHNSYSLHCAVTIFNKHILGPSGLLSVMAAHCKLLEVELKVAPFLIQSCSNCRVSYSNFFLHRQCRLTGPSDSRCCLQYFLSFLAGGRHLFFSFPALMVFFFFFNFSSLKKAILF